MQFIGEQLWRVAAKLLHHRQRLPSMDGLQKQHSLTFRRDVWFWTRDSLPGESYRDDLRTVKKIAAFRCVCFQDMLDGDVGLYSEGKHDNPVYSLSYADHIYDKSLNDGILASIVDIQIWAR